MVCCRVKKEECFETGEGPVETTLWDFAWRLTKKRGTRQPVQTKGPGKTQEVIDVVVVVPSAAVAVDLKNQVVRGTAIYLARMLIRSGPPPGTEPRSIS